MAIPPMIVRAGTREELAEFLVGRHPGTVAVFRHFTWSHLPAGLQPYSAHVCGVAAQMIDLLPDGPELTAGLRKLLEAKDCFVRAGVELRQSIEDAPVELVDRHSDPLNLEARCEDQDHGTVPALVDRHATMVRAELDAAHSAR